MKLFKPHKFHNHTLKNRMVMSAMTRARADQNGRVSDLTALYYSQRASAGLILTEAINISEQAIGSPFTPGLYTQEQVEAWKKITESVHGKGGVIFAQLWHTGRVAHSVDKNGVLPVAPSAIAIKNGQHFTAQGRKSYETPRALTTPEIHQIIKEYGQAAKNAIEAGFDGVEFHAASGYLPNQFLAESSNQRTDDYGGSIQNKSRFIIEVMEELIQTVGGEKVGIKLSPFQPYADIALDNPIETYSYLLQELNPLDFAFVELMKRLPAFPLLSHYPENDEIELFGRMIQQPLIANTGYTKESAEEELQKDMAQLISFGELFLANPDLPKRFELNASLNTIDTESMYAGDGEIGYTDYPFLDKELEKVYS